jgi:hypothetical protein
MTEIAHGKAYFTTSLSFGEYVMIASSGRQAD